MSMIEKEVWTAAMRDHEREVAQLSQALVDAETTLEPAQKMQPHVIYLTAQVMKHQISMALLAARLARQPTLSH